MDKAILVEGEDLEETRVLAICTSVEQAEEIISDAYERGAVLTAWHAPVSINKPLF